MNGYNPYIMGLPYSNSIPQMYEEGMLKRPMPQEGEGGDWLNYIGLGTTAMAPVAAALLNRRRPQFDPRFAQEVSLGQKPLMQVPNPYPQRQVMPSFLSRLLAGR